MSCGIVLCNCKPDELMLLNAGGLIMLHNGFDLENLVFSDNEAYFGGAILLNADLSTNAMLSNLSFVDNDAYMGKKRQFLWTSGPLYH